jgi:hypothetical protein
MILGLLASINGGAMRKILLIIALSLCGYAWSEELTSAPFKGQRPPEKQSACCLQQTLTERNVTVKSPVEVKLLNTGRTPDDIEGDLWMIRLTAVLGVLAFLQLLAFIAQAFYMRRSLASFENTAKKQLRSYVALQTIEHDPQGATGIARGIKIRVKNYGQTPAHHVSIIQTCFEVAQPDTYRHPAITDNDKLANQMLHPDQAFNHFVIGSEGTQCVDRVIDVGLHYLSPFYVYGRIDYMDIYKCWWVTYFCERYDPSKPEGKRCTPHHHHNYEYPIP